MQSRVQFLNVYASQGSTLSLTLSLSKSLIKMEIKGLISVYNSLSGSSISDFSSISDISSNSDISNSLDILGISADISSI